MRTYDPERKARWRRLSKERRNEASGLLDWIAETLEEQGYRCRICSRKFTEELPYRVDHDHSCPCNEGRSPQSGYNGCILCWRGLLCDKCNLGIGMFDDSIRLLAAAIVHLQDYEARKRNEVA